MKTKTPKTFEECRDIIAKQKHGQKKWERWMEQFSNKDVAELYAQQFKTECAEKVREGIRLARKKSSSNECIHCGADIGLHQSETNHCPKWGREETRDGHKQQWFLSTFYPKNELEYTEQEILEKLNLKP